MGIYPEVTQGTARIGGHDEAGTDLAKLRRALVNCDLKAASLKSQAGGQSADSTADNNDLTDISGHRSEISTIIDQIMSPEPFQYLSLYHRIFRDRAQQSHSTASRSLASSDLTQIAAVSVLFGARPHTASRASLCGNG